MQRNFFPFLIHYNIIQYSDRSTCSVFLASFNMYCFHAMPVLSNRAELPNLSGLVARREREEQGNVHVCVHAHTNKHKHWQQCYHPCACANGAASTHAVTLAQVGRVRAHVRALASHSHGPVATWPRTGTRPQTTGWGTTAIRHPICKNYRLYMLAPSLLSFVDLFHHLSP